MALECASRLELTALKVGLHVHVRSEVIDHHFPRANGAKRRSGRKPGARVTNRALGKLKVVVDGS